MMRKVLILSMMVVLLLVGASSAFAEWEPNNTAAQANTINWSDAGKTYGSQYGNVSTTDTTDWFLVDSAKSYTRNVNMSTSTPSSGFSVVVYSADIGGGNMQYESYYSYYSSDVGYYNYPIVLPANASKWYYIQISLNKPYWSTITNASYNFTIN